MKDDADGEDFVPENDTPKTKRGGRPKKKGLDETCEGVGKLGSNMYFYDGGPYMDSDEVSRGAQFTCTVEKTGFVTGG